MRRTRTTRSLDSCLGALETDMAESTLPSRCFGVTTGRASCSIVTVSQLTRIRTLRRLSTIKPWSRIESGRKRRATIFSARRRTYRRAATPYRSRLIAYDSPNTHITRRRESPRCSRRTAPRVGSERVARAARSSTVDVASRRVESTASAAGATTRHGEPTWPRASSHDAPNPDIEYEISAGVSVRE